MPLILAIEPDHRQAAHLRGVVQHRVGAELLLATTTENALDAIGNRVPDLVLVPALLAPQDDAALAAALRVIAAAAHVHTLTIPVFGNASPAPAPGLLGRWRSRGASAPAQGCDPSVFADQIKAYLREAETERADLAESASALLEPSPAILEDDEAPEFDEPLASMEVVDDPRSEEAEIEEVHLEALLDEDEEVLNADASDETIVQAASVDEVIETVIPDLAVIDLAEELERLERFDPLPLAAPARASIEPSQLAPWHAWPALDGMPAEAAAPSEEMPRETEHEWVELVASLRLDLERRRTETVTAKAPVKPVRKAKPVQDEWGFFDPEQCGFSALLKKLDEITAVEESA